jgi:hypothetical protein
MRGSEVRVLSPAPSNKTHSLAQERTADDECKVSEGRRRMITFVSRGEKKAPHLAGLKGDRPQTPASGDRVRPSSLRRWGNYRL